MSMSSPFKNQNDGLVSDINMTPFIDVMLVLLIVFMITLPVIHQSVKVDLPKAVANKIDNLNRSIDISITADGKISWDKDVLSDEQLCNHLDAIVKDTNHPVIRLYADQAVVYGRVAFVMSNAQQRGLTKIDFVMQPVTLH